MSLRGVVSGRSHLVRIEALLQSWRNERQQLADQEGSEWAASGKIASLGVSAC